MTNKGGLAEQQVIKYKGIEVINKAKGLAVTMSLTNANGKRRIKSKA